MSARVFCQDDGNTQNSHFTHFVILSKINQQMFNVVKIHTHKKKRNLIINIHISSEDRVLGVHIL